MTSSNRTRREFLREAALVGGVSTTGGLAGCLDDIRSLGPDGSGGDTSPDTDVPLQSGMRIGLGFTGLGGLAVPSEVDPDEPGGGRMVTVDAADPGEEATVSWKQTVEREITPSDDRTVAVGEETPTPEVEVVEQTGTVTATGLGTAHATYLPMFWDPGGETTDTSGIWLSREAYRELSETRETAWSADPLTRISWVGEEAQERIHSATENVEDVTLEAEADFTEFELTVGSETRTARAIVAYDSFGNEYVVLANEANPLLVKFTYNAVSVGVTGFDTGLWSLIKAVFSGYQVVSLGVARGYG